MDIDKKATSPEVDDKTSVFEGRIEQDAVGKVKPESLAHLSDEDIAIRSRKLTRKMDLFSEPHFPCRRLPPVFQHFAPSRVVPNNQLIRARLLVPF